jgi:hypothetical protein
MCAHEWVIALKRVRSDIVRGSGCVPYQNQFVLKLAPVLGRVENSVERVMFEQAGILEFASPVDHHISFHIDRNPDVFLAAIPEFCPW